MPPNLKKSKNYVKTLLFSLLKPFWHKSRKTLFTKLVCFKLKKGWEPLFYLNNPIYFKIWNEFPNLSHPSWHQIFRDFNFAFLDIRLFVFYWWLVLNLFALTDLFPSLMTSHVFSCRSSTHPIRAGGRLVRWTPTNVQDLFHPKIWYTFHQLIYQLHSASAITI